MPSHRVSAVSARRATQNAHCARLAAREVGCRPVSVAACCLLSRRNFKTRPFEALGVCALIPRSRMVVVSARLETQK
eukprot:3381174-Alexandrium_andersonii.AAC.1